MVVYDERNFHESTINQNFNNTMSVVLYRGKEGFVKKNFCLVDRIVLFDFTDLHLLAFRILDPYCTGPKILSLISVMLSYINDAMIVPSRDFTKPFSGGHLQNASYEA